MTLAEGDRRSVARKVAHAIRWRIDVQWDRARARAPQFLPVLRELRVATGRSTIDLARDLIDAWRGFGVDSHTFGTLMLWEVPKARWREYIVGEDLERFLEKSLDPADRLLSRDKAAFADFDRKSGLPWLPTLAVINRREGVAIEGAAVVETEQQLWSVLAELGRDRDLVVKPSCGERGKGFYRVTRNGELRDSAGATVGRRVLAKTVLSYTHPLGNYGYLVQPALAPHPDMVKLTGIDALATVRVVTALADGAPQVVESFLKIPGPGRLTDNFLSGSKGTTITRFDPETGRLTDLVGLLRPGFRHVLERAGTHPVTGRRVAGEVLPSWGEAIEVAYRAARTHPRSAAIGWDIAIAASGCVILDGNPNWGPGWQPCAPTGIRPLMARLFPADFR